MCVTSQYNNVCVCVRACDREGEKGREKEYTYVSALNSNVHLCVCM